MSRLLLKSIESTDTGECWNPSNIKAVVNVMVPLNKDVHLDQDMTIERIGGKWVASIALDDFTEQDSPELAVDKLGIWLGSLSKAVKGKNVKHLKIAEIFKPKCVR